MVQFFHTLLIVSSDNPDKSNLPHSFVDRRPHILGATPLRALQESMTQMFGVGAERVLRDLRVGVRDRVRRRDSRESVSGVAQKRRRRPRL